MSSDQLNSWLCATTDIQPADGLPCGFPEATTMCQPPSGFMMSVALNKENKGRLAKVHNHLTAYDTFNSDAKDGGPEDFNLDKRMDNTDLEDLDSDAEQHRPQADIAELVVQKAYTECCKELCQTRKALFNANSQHSKWSRNTPSKPNSLMTCVEQEAKKYLLLYHFFIIQSLFPAALNPNTDQHDPAWWKSQDGKLKGTLTELYKMIPADLHESMVTYKQFGSVVHAHSQERSNVLKVIKDCAGAVGNISLFWLLSQQ
ncbi:hypothetical protein F5J12DRAFT_786020 [Pisolithus orientalis]|uniref:uncharacterized protein n=1 Tax=Pisolithus orientalis TaxID=936130 RepID=UPI002224E0F8|nr:uncharacterized protein F5J12DRAFT_786020 [Pisolithus orientalis]KAI5993144.1 hypothetical protein F5J12DRAFT_786020 [Pisolithus orientalis]